MFSRINVLKIVKGHLKTLRSLNQETDRIYWQDFLLFYFFPIIISSILVYKNIGFKSQISNLIAAMSILGGFLFNLLAIIYSSMSNLEKDAETNDIKKRYVHEIHSNISYSILISIFSVFFLILYSIDFDCKCQFLFFKYIIEFINYFLLFNFGLTMLMVLNRIYILLNKNI